MTRSKTLIATAALLLAACGAQGTRDLGDTHDPIIADRMLRQQEIPVVRETGEPTSDGLEALDGFLARMGAGYGDRIAIAGGTAQARRAVVRHLRLRGFFRSRDMGRGAAGTLRVELSRIVLTPPACGDWSDTAEPDHANLPPRNFGCANQSNLARMLADPHDLFSPDSGPYAGDGQRQAAAIGALRTHGLDLSITAAEPTTTED